MICVVAGFVITRRAPRTDPTRAALILWGGWLVVTAVVFSFANGIVHPYYTVALAPAIGACIGIGATLLWRNRFDIRAATALSGTVLVTTILAAVLLSRNTEWMPWLRAAVAVGGVGAAALLLVAGRLSPSAARLGGRAGRRGVSGRARGVFDRDGGDAAQWRDPVGRPGAARLRRFRRARRPAGLAEAGPALSATLAADADDYTWAAAVVGSNNAAGYQLASGAPVMAIGGFNGTDPVADARGVPALRRRRQIHYFIRGRDDDRALGSRRTAVASEAADIAEWVEAHYTPLTVDARRHLRPHAAAEELIAGHTLGPTGNTSCGSTMDVMTDIALERGTACSTIRIAAERRVAARAAGVPVLDVVVPVYNEQAALADSMHRLHRHLRESFPFPARITIADNASVDDTPRIAAELAAELTDVRVVRLGAEGPRPRAARGVVDLGRAGAGLHGRRPVHRSRGARPAGRAAHLRALGPRDRHPAGPGLAGGARRQAGVHLALLQPDPEIHTRGAASPTRSAASRRSAPTSPQRLLPHVADTGWFFDTELLVLAERSGLRIHEVPVDWVDDPDSRVDIVATATADLKGIGRLLRGFANGSIPVNTIAAQLGSSRLSAAPGSLLRQAVRFGAVGVASTAAYVVLFMLMQGWLGAQAANLIALLLTAIGNTAANRRFTFGVGGRANATRHHVEGLIVFGIALAITSGALAVLHARRRRSRTTWSNSPCWCWPTWWPPRCVSSSCAAGCFTRAGPADFCNDKGIH